MFQNLVDFVEKHYVQSEHLVFFAVLPLLSLLAGGALRKWVKARRIKFYQEMLKECSLKLHRNRTDKPVVWAIATSSDFSTAYAELRYPKDTSNYKPWAALRVMPKETFTFVISDQDRRYAHTGTIAELRELLKTIAEKEIIGASLSQFSQAELEQILNVLFVDDKRLFVPFAQNDDKEGERLFIYYGYQNLPALKSAIMKELKRPL